MTRSSEDNMDSVANETSTMDVDYGKHFKVLTPNDQIKGRESFSDEHIFFSCFDCSFYLSK